MNVFLEDGTEVDDDEILLSLPSGTIFIFVPEGEHWSSSATYSGAHNETVVHQNVSASKGTVLYKLLLN